jgi:hypothetical protein
MPPVIQCTAPSQQIVPHIPAGIEFRQLFDGVQDHGLHFRWLPATLFDESGYFLGRKFADVAS